MAISKLDLELLRSKIQINRLRDELDNVIEDLDDLVQLFGAELAIGRWTESTPIPTQINPPPDLIRHLIQIRSDLLEITYSSD